MIALAASGLTLATLLKVVTGALAAGVGVTIAFSALIYCVDRAAELRRERRASAAWALTAGGALAASGCAALVTYGLVLVISKPA